MRRRSAVAVALAVALAAIPARADDAARLDALAEEAWQRTLATTPTLRLQHGLPVEELPDLSFEAAAREAAWATSLLDRLAAIDPRTLDHERWLSHRILRWQAEHTVEGLQHFWHQFQVTPYRWSFSGVGQTLAQLPLAAEDDLARYLDLLDQLPRVAGQLAENLAEQRSRGILLPRPELPLVRGVMGALAAPSAESPFAVAPARLATLPAERAEEFAAEVARRIDQRAAPAFAAVVALLDESYEARAPETVGIGQYPGGDAAYAWLVRYHTTTELAPEEIHRRGLAEMERLEERTAAVRERLGSDLDAGAFHRRLRTDPRFLACTSEEVGARLMAPLERIEPLVGEWFAAQPAAPYGVERLQPELEAGMTFGYYQPPTAEQPVGRYRYNGSQLDQRPLVNAAALVYHELVPGHHFQIALQNENEALPAFRRELYPTAFVEGWAEYASALGEEMGLYREPYDLYGRLGMDAFLSSRLVVDTGMNALGWERQRALAYMEERVLETPVQLATETLRYAVDLPGQALAYKIGAAAFRDLRARAEEALGARFDVRRFHRAVLGHGAMPLAVLEAHVEWWIAQEPAAASPD